MFLHTMQPHWGGNYSRRLFLVTGEFHEFDYDFMKIKQV